MVTKNDSLKQTLREVEKYLKQEGFTVFYGIQEETSDHLTEVLWAEDKRRWRDFLQAAKEAGAKMMVLQVDSLEKDELENTLLSMQEEETPAQTTAELEKHVGEIGHFGLFWFKDGIKYSYDMSTDWWDQFAELAGEYDEEAERPREIPDDVKRKSDRELADELVGFVQKEFPDELDRMSVVAKRLFWESKGLPSYLDIEDDKITLKVKKAESLAQLKLKAEVQKKEKQLVPKLVEECVNWARENGLKKVNKTNVDSFLVEKELTLSKLSRDVIYSRVNLILAK